MRKFYHKCAAKEQKRTEGEKWSVTGDQWKRKKGMRDWGGREEWLVASDSEKKSVACYV